MEEQTVKCMVCEVITQKRYRERHEHGVIFDPDNKIAEGHLIVASLAHVLDALSNPVITAQVMRLAAMRATAPCVIMTQVGKEAGQIQPHFYVHIIPSDPSNPIIVIRQNAGGRGTTRRNTRNIPE